MKAKYPHLENMCSETLLGVLVDSVCKSLQKNCLIYLKGNLC